MHLKQQNNLLINQIWTMENVQQEASSGSLSFHPLLGNKKGVYKGMCQSNSTFWFAVVHVHCGLKEHETQFFFYYHYVICNAFQSQADKMKSNKYASFVNAILIL